MKLNQNWHLEGIRVSGNYMDIIPFTGVVESSRVAYGGKVKHTIILDRAIDLSAHSTRPAGDNICVYHSQLTEVH